MIGKIVTVTIDRKMGTHHPEHKDMHYPINYGFVSGIMGGDGEEQDAYVIGVGKPLDIFTGKVIAIIARKDDAEDKWVVAPDGMTFDKGEIRKQTYFQEKYFDSVICTKK